MALGARQYFRDDSSFVFLTAADFTAAFSGGVIPVANGGTGYAGGAWTPYTATLVPNVGTITQGGSAAFLQIGKLVLFMMDVTVTATTGAPASFTITLPVAVKRAFAISGLEIFNTGIFLREYYMAGQTVGAASVKDDEFNVRAPTLNDEYVFSGCYEAQ
jgi:hypothetical protein